MNKETVMGTDVILGQAVDASVHRRPGIPMELDPPRPAGAAHWTEPEQQRDPGYVLVGAGMKLTPVFGTAAPPRLLSGAMRRAAYRIPEHRTSRWLVLLLADRVDALEHHPARLLPVLALPLVVGGLALARRARRPKGWRAWLRRIDGW